MLRHEENRLPRPLEAALAPHRGRLGFWASYLPHVASDVSDAAPASSFLDPSRLLGEVRRVGVETRSPNLRVAAAQWIGFYTGVVLWGTLLPATLAGAVLDVAAARAHIRFRNGRPAALVLPDFAGAAVLPARWPTGVESAVGDRRLGSEAEFHAALSEGLFRSHLAPLIECCQDVTKLPAKIAWGGAAVHCHYLFAALSNLPDVAPAAAADRTFLLERADSPLTAGGNPLFGALRALPPAGPGGTSRLVRTTCCLWYRLPDGGYCETCPLLLAGPR